MPNEDYKARIREEEIFRAEVQKELASHDRKRITTFLNSSLGIWVLSTLVVGLFGWSYTQWQASRQNIEQINKLDTEIEARIQSAQYRIGNLDTASTGAAVSPANELLAPPTAERIIQSEFAGRNLRSLLYELRGRVPGKEAGPIDIAITNLQSIENEFLNKPVTDRQKKDISERLSNLHAGRWSAGNIGERQRGGFGSPSFFWLIAIILPLVIKISEEVVGWIWKKRKTASATETPIPSYKP